MKKLIVLGAGGYGRTVADVARQLGYSEIFFLDDGQGGHGILGKCLDYAKFADAQTEIYPGIGNNAVRLDWVNRLLAEGIRVPTLIHPTAYVSPEASIGPGTVVLPHALVGTAAQVGRACILNMGSILDHHSVLEDGVHLCPGAIVKGENHIPGCMKIESGQVIQNRTYPL